MEDIISKTVQYTYNVEDASYLINVAILSVDEETQIEGIDNERDKGFIYEVSIASEPALPAAIFEMKNNLIFILGISGAHQFGFVQGGKFTALDGSRFIQTVEARLLEVLMIAGNTGNFTS